VPFARDAGFTQDATIARDAGVAHDPGLAHGEVDGLILGKARARPGLRDQSLGLLAARYAVGAR